MKPHYILLWVFYFVVTSINAQNIEAYKAYIGFEIGILACQNIKGDFSSVHGTFVFDQQKLSNSIIDFSVNAASVTTEKEKYKDRLYEGGFFNFEEYPKIHFKADSIINTKSGYKALGCLTLNGESENIEVKLNLTENEILGETIISRYDFKIATESYPRSFPVHKSVKLKINYLMD